jgi:glyoxalase family protein
MVHRIVWRVSGVEALDFWEQRLTAAGYDAARGDDWLRFEDFEGLAHELAVVQSDDEPLIARHPEIPAELALQGFHAVRAFSQDPERSRAMLESVLGFTPRGEGATWEVRGEHRGGYYIYDEAPPMRPRQGAGTVHHVAWSSPPEDHEEWQRRVAGAGAHATPIIDRYYFRSIYFREPSGVLFEIATIGPGFTVDEPLEHLGEKLSLTPQFEHLRDQIEPALKPLRNPRESWAQR